MSFTKEDVIHLVKAYNEYLAASRRLVGYLIQNGSYPIKIIEGIQLAEKDVNEHSAKLNVMLLNKFGISGADVVSDTDPASPKDTLGEKEKVAAARKEEPQTPTEFKINIRMDVLPDAFNMNSYPLALNTWISQCEMALLAILNAVRNKPQGEVREQAINACFPINLQGFPATAGAGTVMAITSRDYRLCDSGRKEAAEKFFSIFENFAKTIGRDLIISFGDERFNDLIITADGEPQCKPPQVISV